jgi:hypothetical protein
VAILAFMAVFSLDDVHAVRKPRDSWWTVLVVDPIACRLALVVANRTALTPNGLTRLSMLLGLAAAVCFGTRHLAAGAALFYLSFTVDCMDGKIARLKGTGTPFGLWLDYVGDRLRVACCACGLAYGQYAATGRLVYVLLGAGIVLLDLFRYVNGPQLGRVRDAARERVQAAEPVECVFTDDVLRACPAADPGALTAPEGQRLVDPQAEFRARFPWFEPFRRFLLRHRVRTHLVGGIEYHALVFVVAPLIGRAALLPVTVGAGALLALFEAGLVYRTWLAARELARVSATHPSPHQHPDPKERALA